MRAGLQKKSPVRREALSSLLQNWLRLASLPGSSVKCHQQEALQNHPSPSTQCFHSDKNSDSTIFGPAGVTARLSGGRREVRVLCHRFRICGQCEGLWHSNVSRRLPAIWFQVGNFQTTISLRLHALYLTHSVFELHCASPCCLGNERLS